MLNTIKILFLFIFLSMPSTIHAATPTKQAVTLLTQSSARSNKGVVGIITGGINGTYIRIASDLATVLDTDSLRILAIVGKGSVQNISDLLYLKGIDIAIVQSDVLEYIKRHGTYKNIENKVYYIAKLYNEEFHLLANTEIKNLSDLAGQKINFDTKGSGTFITASIIFDTLNIPVEPTYYDQATALDKLKNHEIDALVYVAGKPAQLFDKLTANNSLHFVPIDHTPVLLETYLPTQLNSQDYPNLIEPNQTVKTIAVGAVLAVYNWKSASPRYQKTANFVNHFFENFNEFQQPTRHPKWREVSLSAVIPGWTRFKPAQKWLERQK
ncbi:MAG: TAXI family TRAP transporter solute-binding subunit [Candidatus Competibacteraceae bacterium]|nr:MAG: TAXI family TRAP transporter solute-binding subunit [Candidatus Competibacteraceae bacterium]